MRTIFWESANSGLRESGLIFAIQENVYRIEYISFDHFLPCNVTVSLPASIKGHILIHRYQNIIEELYCEPNDKIVMDCN